jgi:ubiquinone/menaquinone biosynthesis C-methylase UbiE
MNTLIQRPLKLVEDNFRRPEGWPGQLIGHAMARQHRTLTDWTIGLLNLSPADRVLDVGCGSGMAVGLLAAAASDGFVAGVDYSSDMVRQATRRNAAKVVAGKVELRHGDAMELPYPDGSFDVVCAIETFYFWPDPLRGLQEARRVLRPGGQLAVTLEMSREAGGRTYRQRFFGERFARRSAEQGLAILSGDELTELVRAAGFPQPRYVAEPDRSLGWLCALARK